MENDIDIALRIALDDRYKEEEAAVGFVESLAEVTSENATYWFRLGYTTALLKVKKEMNKI